MLEKKDLEMIREVVREEIQGVRVELKEEIQGVRVELKEEIQGVKVELKEEIQGVTIALKEEIREVRKIADKALEIGSRTKLILENDISKKIDVIGEGHYFLALRLEEASRMDKKWERLELELINLRMEFKEMKAM